MGVLNASNARMALPADLHTPTSELKSHLLFHDETTFQANEDQLTLWAAKGTTLMRKGSGIMISDFIKEMGSYWHLHRRSIKKHYTCDLGM